MTDYGYLLILTILLPIVAFMLGVLWNESGRPEDEGMKRHEPK